MDESLLEQPVNQHADHNAHRGLLIQGGRDNALPGAGAGVGCGRSDRAWWLLRLLPAPGGN